MRVDYGSKMTHPTVIWPRRNGNYKVLQFTDGNKPYLRFGTDPRGLDVHERILKNFAQEVGIRCESAVVRDGDLAVLPKDALYRLTGAGRCIVNLEERTAIFGGRSTDYLPIIMKTIDETQLRETGLLVPDWKLTFAPHEF